MGELRDRRVLLIGNGGSAKELFLLTFEPRMLVLSDLSPQGVRAAVRGLDPGKHGHRLCCAAMDALNLPVRSGSVDVLYGNAIVHHLPDLERFFAEVARVLAPRGRAVFMDDAYSPAWQAAKLSVLRPLMRLSHRRELRSPEDQRATLEGGFRDEDLSRQIRAVGCEPFFERHDLLFYVWTRAAMTLAPARFRRPLMESVWVARLLTRVDSWLAASSEAVQRNQVRLVWGMLAPPGAQELRSQTLEAERGRAGADALR
jgi:SAM-dependent methyltransferase